LPTSDHKFEILYAWKDRWSNRRQNYASDSTHDYETITCTNEDNVLQNLQSLLQSQEVQYAATVTERDREESERPRAVERREREQEEESEARRSARQNGHDGLRHLSQLTHLEQLREYLVPQISTTTGTVSMPMLESSIAQDFFELSCPGILVTLQNQRAAINGYLYITLAPHTSTDEFEMFYKSYLGRREGEGRRIKLNCRDQRHVLYFIRNIANA
jgi:hypothetical protein